MGHGIYLYLHCDEHVETSSVGNILMDLQQPPNFDMQVMSAKLVEELNAELQWRKRALEAEAKVKELQTELDALKPKEAPK